RRIFDLHAASYYTKGPGCTRPGTNGGRRQRARPGQLPSSYNCALLAAMPIASSAFEVVSLDRWNARVGDLAERYRAGRPFPHIRLQGLLTEEALAIAVAEFPKLDDPAWISYKHYNENKVGLTRLDTFPAGIRHIVEELNAPAFVGWLEKLTGIDGLISDPMLDGGGMHQSGRGGFLNVHADFTAHHHHRDWRRRVNLIVYLNQGWREEWGGAIELWERDMKRCAAKMLPEANNALIFNTDETSYHGFADPLRCPEGVTRKSIALYYYTPEAAGSHAPRSTDYRARPGDGAARRSLIWLDKKAVDAYSRVKSALGLSDDFAGKVLGKLSRRK